MAGAAGAAKAPAAGGEPAGRGHGFGTAPVFLASISTILGAILFLRFGYAVAHTGLVGAIAIILLGHLVTVPTALAIAEIATNRKVEGGGEYFIVSRSFGTTIGAAIGISLYFSQAISVAFYMIAFAEAFQPLVPWFERTAGLAFDPRYVSLPGTLILCGIVYFRGASLGVQALWVVAVTLAVSLGLFFLGGPPAGVAPGETGPFERVADPDPFMLVFAIVFPAFTGMTAGVGLSGDLRNPRRSIPLGILSATAVGLVMYVLVVIKLAASASPELLAGDQLVMAQIAIWGPIIPIGLACATISSAIGSVLIAPRTLQALGADRVSPVPGTNRWLAAGHGPANEPRHATLVTSVLAVVTVSLGNVDFVARIISMFFMVTYGALCTISFLEHFAARPGYRPSFRSKWYISLVGAAGCLLLMVQMDLVYSLLALAIMALLYRHIRAARGGADDLAAIVEGVMTQTTRHFQIRLQNRRGRRKADDWRPSIIAVNSRTFNRAAPVELLAWLCHRYGFGTYLHLIPGTLNAQTYRESLVELKRLVAMMHARESAVYVDTIISPSPQSAVAQSVQVPGVSGMENNTLLLELSVHDGDDVVDEILSAFQLANAAHMNTLVLRHGEQFFGTRQDIHVWFTWHDYDNANLMILLAYILLGHPAWREAEVHIFAAFPRDEVEAQRAKLHEMIQEGRLPISSKNVRIIPTVERTEFDRLVETISAGADLTILGFTEARLQKRGGALFRRFPALHDVLFVSAREDIAIE